MHHQIDLRTRRILSQQIVDFKARFDVHNNNLLREWNYFVCIGPECLHCLCRCHMYSLYLLIIDLILFRNVDVKHDIKAYAHQINQVRTNFIAEIKGLRAHCKHDIRYMHEWMEATCT